MNWNDAIPDAGSVAFILFVALVCGFCFYMQSREARRALIPSGFPGLHGLSEELARIVARLSSKDLTTVVDAALDIIADDFAGDAHIEQAIAAYRSDRQNRIPRSPLCPALPHGFR